MFEYTPFSTSNSNKKKSGAQDGFHGSDRPRVGLPLNLLYSSHPPRSHEERGCSILGPTQSRISPSILQYAKEQSRFPRFVEDTNNISCG